MPPRLFGNLSSHVHSETCGSRARKTNTYGRDIMRTLNALAVVLTIGMLMMMATPAMAAPTNFTDADPANSDWNNAANWDNGVPTFNNSN